MPAAYGKQQLLSLLLNCWYHFSPPFQPSQGHLWLMESPQLPGHQQLPWFLSAVSAGTPELSRTTRGLWVHPGLGKGALLAWSI